MSHVGYLIMGNNSDVHYLKHDDSPRQFLLDYYGRKRCDKIYRDTKGGKTRHVGYKVAGIWFEVFRVFPWKEAG